MASERVMRVPGRRVIFENGITAEVLELDVGKGLVNVRFDNGNATMANIEQVEAIPLKGEWVQVMAGPFKGFGSVKWVSDCGSLLDVHMDAGDTVTSLSPSDVMILFERPHTPNDANAAPVRTSGPLTQGSLDDILSDFHEKRGGATRAKRKQYSGGGDVLANFRRRAQLLGVTPEQVIVSDLSKHIDAIAKAVQAGTIDAEWVHPDGAEGYLQKIGDAITYLELLAGRATERGE